MLLFLLSHQSRTAQPLVGEYEVIEGAFRAKTKRTRNQF